MSMESLFFGRLKENIATGDRKVQPVLICIKTFLNLILYGMYFTEMFMDF